VDAPGWPAQPDVWLQAERTPRVPEWDGLTIERLHRVPMPGFLDAGAIPLDRRRSTAFSNEVFPAAARPAVPPSSLAPLGWDARAVCRKEVGE
jgi:hypothetical protein